MFPILKTLCGGMIALALIAAAGARAQETPTSSPYYVGGDVGVHTQFKLDCWNGIECDDRANRSGRLYAGYSLGSNLVFGRDNSNAVELSAFGFGNVKTLVQYTGDGGYLPGRSKVYGLALNYASGLKLGGGLSLTSRVGLSLARSSVQFADAYTLNNYGAEGGVRHNRFGLTYGLGLSYALDKNWSLNGDWTRVPAKLGGYDATHVNMFSVGTSYHF